MVGPLGRTSSPFRCFAFQEREHLCNSKSVLLMADGLLPRPLTEKTVHLCVDMQRIFSPEGPWATPWMEKVLPIVTEIAQRFPERTVFTRFITPQRAEDMPGMWRRYYERWAETTRERLDPGLLELVPPLARLVPPAVTIDKTRYSGFVEAPLFAHLRERGADALIVTGSETDVCVLATVLGAVDLGYRVILVRDAVCSSSDDGHDAMLQVYHRRYSEQIETADAETILSQWN
jgi:nicotinamidase-related amidase